MDKFAGHPGGQAGKHVQVGEITMVDGTDSVWGLVWFGPKRGGGRSGERWGRTLFVIIWYLEGLCVCVNYILAKTWIAYLRVTFAGNGRSIIMCAGGRGRGTRVGEGVESRLTTKRQRCLADR